MQKLLEAPKHGFSKASSMNVPEEPGVYLVYDKKSEGSNLC